MTTTVLQIEQMNASTLMERLDQLENAFKALVKNSVPAKDETKDRLLRRKDVSELLAVSLVTVDDWTRKGILTAYKAGKRVYYKSSEVEKALVKKGGCYVRG